MYGEEAVLTFVTIPHATASELVGSIFRKSTTPGALSLMQGVGLVPPHRRMGLAFGRRGT